MPKNILQDVLAKERKSIRQVPLPVSRRNEEPDESAILYARPEPEPAPVRGGSRYVLWGTVALFVLLLAVLASWSFGGATITVTPKSSVAVLDHSFTAIRNGGSGALHFEAVPIVKTAEKTIPAETEKRVSERASGRITVYNNFSVKPQRLIKNTRFQTPDGLIYRVDRSIVVPGQTKTEKGMTPGNVEAVVYADAAGGEYNIPLADFTIPGFKNDPARFSGFYARSKTPMTGGREGLIKTPSKEAERRAREALAAGLRESVLAAARSQTPDGYLLFANAVSLAPESLPLEPSGKDAAVVKEKLSAIAYLFRSSELASAIAARGISSYSGLPVEVPNISDLTFSFADATARAKEAGSELRFTLKGSPRVVWLVDAGKLQSAIAGNPKAEFSSVLSAFPAVLKADVVLRPFWSRTFPENPKKIRVEVVPAS